jgi:hypothetical protein
VRAPRRPREEGGQVGGLQAAQGGPRERILNADRDHHQPAGEIRSRVGQQTGLGPAECDGDVGGQHGAGGLAGVRLHTAGHVACHHEAVGPFRQPRHEFRRGSPESALGAGSEQRVNNDVGPAGQCCHLAGIGVRQHQHPAAGAPKGGQAVRVGRVRGEDRRRPHSPSGEVRGGEEAVAAVVALACQDNNAGAVQAASAAAQFRDGGAGHATGCPLHENSAHT